MEKFVIDGGVPLRGTVVPAGNKNGALPILAASVLTTEEVVVRNVPRIRDVEAMLASCAASASRSSGATTTRSASARPTSTPRRRSTASTRAASARRSCSPGRCSRASATPTCRRPAATSSAAAASTRTSTPSARWAPASSTSATSSSTAPDGGLRAGEVFMDEPSVMATENALMAAALTPGTT